MPLPFVLGGEGACAAIAGKGAFEASVGSLLERLLGSCDWFSATGIGWRLLRRFAIALLNPVAGVSLASGGCLWGALGRFTGGRGRGCAIFARLVAGVH